MTGTAKTAMGPSSLDRIPDFPPHVSDIDIAFPSAPLLPDREDLPDAYRLERAPGCRVAEAIFGNGWPAAISIAKSLYGEDLDLRTPPEDHDYTGERRDPVERFQRAVHVHLGSFGPKHEDKIAGTGYLIDLWLGQIAPRSGSER